MLTTQSLIIDGIIKFTSKINSNTLKGMSGAQSRLRAINLFIEILLLLAGHLVESMQKN